MGELEKANAFIPKEVHDAYAPILNANEFLDGMRDAKESLEHREGMGAEYDRGYAAQYQLEQLMGRR